MYVKWLVGYLVYDIYFIIGSYVTIMDNDVYLWGEKRIIFILYVLIDFRLLKEVKLLY